jgi:hypothetical protein
LDGGGRAGGRRWAEECHSGEGRGESVLVCQTQNRNRSDERRWEEEGREGGERARKRRERVSFNFGFLPPLLTYTALETRE